MKIFFWATFSLLILIPGLKAQNQPSSDELFKDARTAAFEQKDYNRAKLLAYHALALSPAYSDAEIFIGRLFMWEHRYDSARVHFTKVLKEEPSNEDASVANADVELWDHQYECSLTICNNGLAYHPNSADLLLRKAKNLKELKEYREAGSITNQLLKNNPNNKAARDLQTSLTDATAVNKIMVGYENASFDNQYDKDWNFGTLSYTRNTNFGPLTGRVNYAGRFGKTGFQGEIEAYPHLCKTFYVYINIGYSAASVLFPQYRAGFSFYAGLPNSFEGEIGYRYLYFNSPVHIYTAALGKYWKNFLFTGRTYIAPSSANVAQSYSLRSRYFLKGADDYVSLLLGTGYSPDDNNQNIRYSNKQNMLSSRKIVLDFSHTIFKWNIILFSAGLINQEYETTLKGNQLIFSLSFSHRF